MALRKSDLYSSLWKSCDELRGGMDASQYKDYILTLLFVKYVSDKAKADKNSLIDVPAAGSFDDMIALKGDKEIAPGSGTSRACTLPGSTSCASTCVARPASARRVIATPAGSGTSSCRRSWPRRWTCSARGSMR